MFGPRAPRCARAGFRAGDPCTRARRRPFSSSGMASGMCCAVVFGRGEYWNANTPSYCAASSKESVSSKSSSVSPGKPTMMSDVTLIGPARCANHGDLFEIFLARVGAQHLPQDARRSRLHRQVNVIAQLRHRVDRLDDVAPEIPRVRRRETHAPNSRNCRHGHQKFRKSTFVLATGPRRNSPFAREAGSPSSPRRPACELLRRIDALARLRSGPRVNGTTQ